MKVDVRRRKKEAFLVIVNVKKVQKSLDGSWNEFLVLGVLTSFVEFILLFLYYHEGLSATLNLEKIMDWYWFVIILGVVIGIVVAVISFMIVKRRSLMAAKKLAEMAENEDLLLEMDEEDLTLTKNDVMIAVLVFTIGIVLLNLLFVFTPLNMIIRRHDLNLLDMSIQIGVFYVITFVVSLISSFLSSQFFLPSYQEVGSSKE